MSGKYLDQDTDIPILLTGFQPSYTPTERKNAEAVLKRIGYQKIMKGPAWKQKPGRKKTANPTEKEINIRLEFLRLVLGDAANKLLEKRILSAVVELLNLYIEQCSTGLYLTQVERGKIQIITGKNSDAVAQMSGYPALRPELPVSWGEEDPTESELTLWLAHLEKAQSKSRNVIWANMVDEAISQPASKLDKKQLYEAIRLQLGQSYEGRSVAEIEARIEILEKEHPKNASAIAETTSKIELLKNEISVRELYNQNISRNKTLWAATAGLLDMRNVLDSCRFVRVDTEIERLYSFIRCCCYRTDPRQIPAVLAELNTLFLEAISRQGHLSRQRHSPFIPLFNEDLEPGPSWIPEDGQLKAKPPRKERIDSVELVTRIVRAAGNSGIGMADLLKALLKDRQYSQASAYNAISSAEKKKKIKKLNGKRYVVFGEKVMVTPFVPPPPQRNPAMDDFYKILDAGLNGIQRKAIMESFPAFKEFIASDKKRPKQNSGHQAKGCKTNVGKTKESPPQ